MNHLRPNSHRWPRWLTTPVLLLLQLFGQTAPSMATPNAAPLVQSINAVGQEFTHNGPGYTLTYRFIPNTGTLGDLSVIYNNSFVFNPSISGGIYWVNLAGEDLSAWDGRLQRQFVSESLQNGIYTANYRWSYNGDSLEFTVRLWQEQNKLHIQYDSLSEKISQFHLDRSANTPYPKVIELPYGHNVLYTNGIFISGMIDHETSNASLLNPINLPYLDASSSAYYGYKGDYNKLTNHRRRPLHEKVIIAVSPTIEEVFHYPNNPASPYKNFLTDKVVVDLWRNKFADHRTTIQQLADRGLTDLFVILHRWQRDGYDRGLPHTYPAGMEFGNPTELQQIGNLCQANNYRFALHTNYAEKYTTAPSAADPDLALDSDGKPKASWQNYAGEQSYVMKSPRSLHYANIYEPLIHADYRTTAAFLDVHTAPSPGDRTDQDAAIADPGRQTVVLLDYRNLVDYARNLHSGPVAGEGFGYTAPLWAGYVDAIEADPRSKDDIDSKRIGSSVPTLVDYKLRALHHLFVPHGVGYLERFYPEEQNSFTTAELERYRATELAFGNAGFMSDLFERNFSNEQALNEAVREYCVMKSLQKRYLPSTPTTIRYYLNNGWLTLSDALRTVLPGAAFADVDRVLSEQLGIVQVQYANGLALYVNRSANRTIDVTLDTGRYTVPPNGFVARQGSDFLAYNAIVNGIRSHYICPSEGICSTCPPPASTLKNGDFELGANGDWRTVSQQGQELITNQAPVTPRSGSYVAHLGGTNRENATLAQTVQLPGSGALLLQYHYQTRSSETRCNSEKAEVRINGKRVATYPLCSAQATTQWRPATLNLSRYAGQHIELLFTLKTNSSLPSSFLLDDLLFTSAVGTQTHSTAIDPNGVVEESAAAELVACTDTPDCVTQEAEDAVLSDSPGYMLYLPVANHE